MNTKLNNIEVNPVFEDLFTFKSIEDKIEHDAQMISYRILSELERICDQKNISRKALADMVGTSKSYITQLFNGTKSINASFMAKCENALDARFEVSCKLMNDDYSKSIDNQYDKIEFANLKPRMGWSMFTKHPENDEVILGYLEPENAQKQVA